MAAFDAIVIGLGAMGGSALYHLARRGANVLGIEQYSIGHDRGSSHGQTRIIRKAYFEHPDYVPLLHRSYDLWGELEVETGRKLFERIGLLMIGPPEGPVLAGASRSAREHGLNVRPLSRAEMANHYPGFRLDEEMAGLFEPDAGFLRVEACVHAQTDRACEHGATVVTGEAVKTWSSGGHHVKVTTDSQNYTARSLVICGGPWAGSLIQGVGLPLHVRRKVVVWFLDRNAVFTVERGCPVFAFDTPNGFFYGFPVLDEYGVKVAEHTGGETVLDPAEVDRNLQPSDIERLIQFTERHMPGLSAGVLHHSVCLYTMTPDEHFIIDRDPAHENVFFAAGFSGHGFKFAPVIGSVLADWVLEGMTREPVRFLSLSRPALQTGGVG